MKLEKLFANLENLRLLEMKELLVNDTSISSNTKLVDFLLVSTQIEIDKKDLRGKKQMIKTAAFPAVKTISDFDFSFNEEINKGKVLDLATLGFIDKNENILLIGSPGVGKTHLSIGIGVNAASIRISTYFIKSKKLLDDLRMAQKENRLEKRLKHYRKYKLLIIDELGFLPINESDAKLLFQLIDLRYETRSTIITSNILLEKWDTIFADALIANAILDRLLHHSHVFKITGSSYRLKEFI